MRRRGPAPAPIGAMLGAALTTCVSGAACKAQEDPGLRSLTATRERPLFSPTRRPPPLPPPIVTAPPVPAPEPVRETPPPTFRLTGIVLGDAEEIAIVQRPQDPKPTNLRIDSVIDGWTVVDIRSREIVLKHEDRTIIIHMADQVTSPKTTAQPDL